MVSTRTFRITEEDEFVDEFLETIPKGKRTKTIIDALKMYIINFDISFVHMHIAQLKVEIGQYEKLIAWKKEKDKLEIKKLIQIQRDGALNKYFDRYEERKEYGEDIQEKYLEAVLPDIQHELDYPLTIEQFKEYYNNRKKSEVKG